LTPGKEGEPATFVWRPETAAVQIEASVATVAANQPLGVTVTSPAAGVISVTGQIPVNQGNLVQTYQVPDPPAFARTLLIEALGRAGVTVAAPATGPNPDAKLPPAGSYAEGDRVALFTSPPFSQNIKLILKDSLNQHADMMIFMLALKHGETSFDARMTQIRPFLEKVGLDPALVSLSDGRGNEYTDLFSPRTVSALLRAMTTRSDFTAFYDALPILGVDGTEVDTVPATSPVGGKTVAKSGTTIAGDVMNSRPLTMVRGLAGYVTAKSGRELIYAIYVSDVPLTDTLDIFAVIKDQGAMVEVIYALN
jgi:D-alanyl-D-alanine carboxypeptidase/D-alanyl-D-alanine-endopeptidase (penicillin-binding protein 4)